MGGRTTEVEIRIGSPVSFNLAYWIKRQNPDFKSILIFSYIMYNVRKIINISAKAKTSIEFQDRNKLPTKSQTL